MSQNDPYASADDPQVIQLQGYGFVQSDAFHCVLEKGIGKVPYDETQHDEDRKLTAITIDSQAFKRDGTVYETQREYIAEFGNSGWAGITLVSLKTCGVHPQDLDNGRWAHWEMERTGRTWADRVSGETRYADVYKFLEFYADEATCRAAYESRGGGQTSQASTLDSTHPMPEENKGNGSDAQRVVAAKFLPALWNQAAGDVTKLGELIASNPLTSRFFDLNSAEVAAIVAGEAV